MNVMSLARETVATIKPHDISEESDLKLKNRRLPYVMVILITLKILPLSLTSLAYSHL
jgi:hypothetical protein